MGLSDWWMFDRFEHRVPRHEPDSGKLKWCSVWASLRAVACLLAVSRCALSLCIAVRVACACARVGYRVGGRCSWAVRVPCAKLWQAVRWLALRYGHGFS